MNAVDEIIEILRNLNQSQVDKLLAFARSLREEEEIEAFNEFALHALAQYADAEDDPDIYSENDIKFKFD
jgi:hypothetical protein